MATTLGEIKLGGKQSDGTIALDTKFSTELQLGPITGGGEARIGLQSTVGGGQSDGFAGAQLSLKKVSGWGYAANARWDIFNWSYKK